MSGPFRIQESRAPSVDRGPPAYAGPVSSGQATPRHPEMTTYGCFLPDLTGFAGPCRVRPNHPRHLARAVPQDRTSRGDSVPL